MSEDVPSDRAPLLLLADESVLSWGESELLACGPYPTAISSRRGYSKFCCGQSGLFDELDDDASDPGEGIWYSVC